MEIRNIPPSFVITKLQLQRKQSGYNHTLILLQSAIAPNGNTTHLLERLSVIVFMGRGVADSKVAIALLIYLAKALKGSPQFNGSLFLGFDAQEESGNFSGIREILHHSPKADVCILGYQSFDEIAIGARGWLKHKLATYGKAAHTSSRSKKGRNAVHALIRVCSTL